MLRISLLTTLIFVLAFASGCVEPEFSDEQYTTITQEARAGCVLDCPRCVPNQPCSMRACFEVCHGQSDEHRNDNNGNGNQGEECGSTTCGDDEVCCNASCGICTPPGWACIALACEVEPDPSPQAECQTDDDCYAFSNYCGGCNCEARAAGDTAAICRDDDLYNCLVDPCDGSTGVCVAGLCELGGAVR